MERDRRAIGALLVVQLLFGLFPVAAKKVFPYLDPMPILALRVGGAAVCLVAASLLLVRDPIPMRQLGWRVTGLAFLGVILNMGLFMVGLQHTTPTEAVLVITSIPVFTYAIAVAMGRETIGPRRVLGIALALAGVIVLTLQAAQRGRMHLVGDLLILANALSYAAFLVLAKPITQRHDPLSLTTWVFVIGAAFFVPVGFALGLRDQVAAAPPSAMWWMLFIILGATVFTYALNTLALRRVHASTVAAFTYVQPLFTAAASYLLLGERLRWVLLPAAALVFAGVWLVARRDPPALEGQGQVVAE